MKKISYSVWGWVLLNSLLLLVVILSILKGFGIISISLLWILAPIWIPLTLVILIAIIFEIVIILYEYEIL